MALPKDDGTPFRVRLPKPRVNKPRKDLLVRALEVELDETIDANKICDYRGGRVAVTIVRSDYVGSRNCSFCDCPGARGAERSMGWRKVAFGDHVGYGLAADGWCYRFTHDNAINIAVDSQEIPIGKVTYLTAPAPTQRLAGTKYKSRARKKGAKSGHAKRGTVSVMSFGSDSVDRVSKAKSKKKPGRYVPFSAQMRKENAQQAISKAKH